MRKTIKKILSIAMALTMALTVVIGIESPVFAAETNTKNENVYVLLNDDGSTKNVYVVNGYENFSGGEFADYGDYNSVENLSTLAALNASSGKVSGNITKGKFNYKGEVKNPQIPWNIVVSYKLDGKEITPEQIAGKSGKVEIMIDITQNANANKSFYENYTLQISSSLNMKKCQDIVAENATIANAGENKSITFMLLPNKDGSFKISTTAQNFAMGAISINGVPFSMKIDIDGMDGMTSQFSALSSGISKVNDGAVQLQTGATAYKAGADALSANSDNIINGSAEMLKGITNLSSSVGAMGENAPPELVASLKMLKEQYSKLNDGIASYAGGVKQTATAFKGINDGISGLVSGTKELKKGTSGLDEKVEGQIDEAIKTISNPDFKPVSFTSDKNTNVSMVQFVMRTNSIEITKPVIKIDETPKKLSFWKKLTNLFK